MNKKYIILEPGGSVAKTSISDAGTEIKVETKGIFLENDEVFAVYGACKEKVFLLGVMTAPQKSFFIAKTISIDAVAITTKNINSGKETIAAFGGENEFLKDCLSEKNIKRGDAHEAEETSLFLPPGSDTPSDVESENKTDGFSDKFTFENFFGINFSWQRIDGYFIPENYKILKYALSSKNAYMSINSAGHYFFGRAKNGDADYFALALKENSSIPSPFSHLDTKTYEICDGNQVFCALCIGVDESGEFFSVI